MEYDGPIHWLDEGFPTDIENLLLDEDLDDMNDVDFGSEVESRRHQRRVFISVYL